MKCPLCALPLAIAAVLALPAHAAETGPASPLSWKANARLRHEHVSDDAFVRSADATTLRLRLGLGAKLAKHVDAFVEAEGTAVLDDSYNSTANGKTALPAVADPEAAEINQAWLRWTHDAANVAAGRQRVAFDNHRWIGNSGWRQNEQTFDAVSAEWRPVPAVVVRHAWLDRVHRVNTDQAIDPLARERALDTHALNVGVERGRDRFTAYAYLHEDEDVASASSMTWGARWATDRVRDGAGWGMALELARQRDYADAPGFSHSYWLAEPSLTRSGITVRAGWEHLGGDGRHALQTPLATLHAFNGWADRFVTTPAGGLEDRYVSAGGKLGREGYASRVAWTVVYHDYEADTGARFGREVDASLAFPVGTRLNALVKLADYRSDGFARDLTKLWVQLEWNR